MLPEKCPWCSTKIVNRTYGIWGCDSWNTDDTNFFQGHICSRIEARDALWRVRMALTEIGFIARLEWQRRRWMNSEVVSIGFNGIMAAQIGAGGDTA